MPENLLTIQRAHNGWVDSLLQNFQSELSGILAAAQARTVAQLREQLTTEDGKIIRSVKNAKALRKFDQLFLDNLDRAGYQHLLNELVNQFPGQLQYFQDTLNVISEGMKNPLPTVKFGPRDLQVFTDQGLSAKDSLQSVMESVAAQAQNRILMSVGGLPFADLAESLAGYLQKALPEAVGLAETATATYYRIIADRGYQIIEQDLPSQEVRYKYAGPDDKLTRPFCRHLVEAGKSYTRAEIDEMDNGQIPNVFISAGGWRCRHQWLIALEAKHQAQPEARPPSGSEIRESVIKAGEAFEGELNALKAKLSKAYGIGDKHDRLAEVSRLNLQIDSLAKQRDAAVKSLLYQGESAKPKISYSSKPVPAGWSDGVSEFARLIGPGKVDGLPISIKGTSGGRANYQSFKGIVKASKKTRASIIVHELGHWLEEAVPDIGRKAQEFLVRRTTTNGARDNLVKLNSFNPAYRPQEVTRPDKFENEYTGKSYSANGKVYATEIMSMGLQALSERPVSFAKADPDFFEFVLDTIRAK